MNDFHKLSICIQNKDVTGAMRILRDKSEFAVRKILEKIKIKVTQPSGRAFWHYVQNWLLAACRQGNIQHETFRTRRASQPQEYRQSQSGRTGYGQAHGTYGHAHRSHQHSLSDASRAADVCAWPDGLPPVHAYMGDERATYTRTSAGEGKPAVALGHRNATGIQSGLPASPAVVGTEHSVRVRRRHAAARPAAPVWQKGKSCRRIASGTHDFSTSAGKLWSARNYAGRQPGDRYWQKYSRNEMPVYLHSRAVTSLLKRTVSYTVYARRNIIAGHTACSGVPPGCGSLVQGSLPGRTSAIYAA